MKSPTPASEFTTQDYYKKVFIKFDPTILIGHNRASTQGEPSDNNNNHPLYTDNGLQIIHNGMISNDAEIIEKYKLKRKGLVDSEAIVLLIDYLMFVKGKTAIQAIQQARKELKGSMTIAMLNAHEPKTLYLMASDNPLSLAYHQPTGTIFFASTEMILEKGITESQSYFGGLFRKDIIPSDYIFTKIEDNTGLRITAKNWQEFKVEKPPYVSDYKPTGEWKNGAWHRYADDYEMDDEGYPIPRVQQKLKGFISAPKSKQPADIEISGIDAIKNELDEYRGFDVTEAIKKPSKYLSEALLYRLEYIQEILYDGSYEEIYDEKEMVRVYGEIRRIIYTLQARKKFTKRKDIYVPTNEEIILFRDRKVDEVHDFKSIGWILTDKNRDLMMKIKDTPLMADRIDEDITDALDKESKEIGKTYLLQ